MKEEEAPNHLIYKEGGEDGMAHFRLGCTLPGCLLVLCFVAVIVLLIVLRRTGVI